MLQIFIARHGQNVDNAEGILNGHRDLPLTDLGRLQGKQLAAGIRAAGLQFDKIYSSPLSRALETAQIVAHDLELPEPAVLDLLIERDFGSMTGKPIADIERLCSPNIIKAEVITYFLSPEGAETFPDLVERGQKIIQRIRAENSDGRVLLVCHGDLGKMIYCAATGKDWRVVLKDFHFGNGDLIEISHGGEAHRVKLEQHNA